MEWDNDDDRLAMVRWGGYYCDDDIFDPDECERCIAKDECSKYKEYLKEEQEAIEFAREFMSDAVHETAKLFRQEGRWSENEIQKNSGSSRSASDS